MENTSHGSERFGAWRIWWVQFSSDDLTRIQSTTELNWKTAFDISWNSDRIVLSWYPNHSMEIYSCQCYYRFFRWLLLLPGCCSRSYLHMHLGLNKIGKVLASITKADFLLAQNAKYLFARMSECASFNQYGRRDGFESHRDAFDGAFHRLQFPRRDLILFDRII